VVARRGVRRSLLVGVLMATSRLQLAEAIGVTRRSFVRLRLLGPRAPDSRSPALREARAAWQPRARWRAARLAELLIELGRVDRPGARGTAITDVE